MVQLAMVIAAKSLQRPAPPSLDGNPTTSVLVKNHISTLARDVYAFHATPYLAAFEYVEPHRNTTK